MRQAHPVSPTHRILQIDILRGFALAGILVVNILGYNASLFDFGGFYGSIADPGMKNIYQLIIGLASDKFIFLFSLLFGMGFYMIYQKPWADEKSFRVIYSRRLFFLMLFGMLHILLFWAGDILLGYAILGFILLGIRKWKSSWLIVLSTFLYFFPALYILLHSFFPSMPDSLSSITVYTMEDILPVYSHGSYFEIMKLRIHEFWAFRYINTLYYWPKILSLFIAGMLISKHSILKTINSHRATGFSFLAVISLIAVLLFFTFEYIATILASGNETLMAASYMGSYEFMNLFFGFGYFLLIVLLTSFRAGSFLLKPFSYAGRMALSNYIMQSLIGSLIFYGYGLRMFGMVRLDQLLLIALGIFIFQVLLSWMILRRYRFGPLEWLWRKLTYGTT